MSSGQSSSEAPSTTGSLTSVASSYFNPLTSVQSFTDLHFFYGFPSAVISEYAMEELNRPSPAGSLQSDYLPQEQPLSVSSYVSV